MAAAGERVVLRWPSLMLHEAPRIQGISFEAIVRDERCRARRVAARARDGARARLPRCARRSPSATPASTAIARRRRRAVRSARALPIRARWDGPLDVKGAALALTFGADELAGPMAPPKQRYKLAQLGGPPEDGGRPSPAFVESLIQAAGRFPARRK